MNIYVENIDLTKNVSVEPVYDNLGIEIDVVDPRPMIIEVEATDLVDQPAVQALTGNSSQVDISTDVSEINVSVEVVDTTPEITIEAGLGSMEVEDLNAILANYEPILGNPSLDGYLLTSTASGTRSWAAPYSHPTPGAINQSSGTGQAISAVQSDASGHLVNVSVKTLTAADIPTLDTFKLSDMPSSFSGEGGNFLKVNSGETGYELDTIASINYWTKTGNDLYFGEGDVYIGGSVGNTEITEVYIDTGSYKIEDINVLTSDTLGSGIVNSSLTNLGTLTELNVDGNVVFGGASGFNWNNTTKRLGIGTDNPQYANIQVYDSGTAGKLRFQNAQTGTGTTDGFVFEMGARQAYVWLFETDRLYFGTGNTIVGLFEGNGDFKTAYNTMMGTKTGTAQNVLDIKGGCVIGSNYAGVNSSPTDGLLVEGNLGVKTTSPDRSFHVTVDDLVINTVTYAQRLTHKSSNTPAANFGTGIEFELEDNSGNDDVAATIECIWTDAVNGQENSALIFKTVETDDDGLVERARIDKDGNFNIIGSFNATSDNQAIYLGSTGWNYVSDISDTHLALYSQGAEMIRLDGNNQKVGVGTTSPDTHFHIEDQAAITNTVHNVQRITAITNTTPANGIGVGIELEVETSVSNNEVVAVIEGIAEDVTATSEDGAVVIKTMSGGAAATESFRVNSNGVNIPSGSTYKINGVPLSSGVDTSGTPADNQIAVFVDADTIEGDSNLTWDGQTLVVNYGFSTYVGYDCGIADDGTNNLNCGFGRNVLYANTSGSSNSGFGNNVLYACTTGDNNSGFGVSALNQVSTGDYNIAFGGGSLADVTTTSGNTGLGFQAGNSCTGEYSLFLGYQAGFSETGSNKLYIENSNSSTPLIYGEFDNDLIHVNGILSCGTYINYSSGGSYSFAGGKGYASGSKKILASGQTSFNFSENTTSQTDGYGALADYSAILVGIDHNIAQYSCYSAILAGKTNYIGSSAITNEDRCSLVLGGYSNSNYCDNSIIAGGYSNQAGDNSNQQNEVIILGGNNNGPVYADNVVLLGCSSVSPDQNNTTFAEHLCIQSDRSFYIGMPATNNTWKMAISSNNVVFSRRETGSYDDKISITSNGGINTNGNDCDVDTGGGYFNIGTSDGGVELDGGTGGVVIVTSGIGMTMPRLSSDPGGSPTNGDIYYNTTTNKFRGYENGSWANLI